MSAHGHAEVGERLAAAGGKRAIEPVVFEQASAEQRSTVEAAFLSRDVTGASTKHQQTPETQAFYDALLAAPKLRWVQIHSAGADRAIYGQLRAKGVEITTAAGANATIVAQTALAGILALGRRFAQVMQAQREHRWASFATAGIPPDLAGQTVVLVGWGPVARKLARLLTELEMPYLVVRNSAEPADGAQRTVPFDRLHEVLPQAQWLVLACPLTDKTRNLIDGPALARMPPGARVVNVARGEVVDEPKLIEALQSRYIGGAFLDVFAHEPLPATSPLWDMENVFVWPHSAGHSAGNESRVADRFLDNLARFAAGGELHNRIP